jgi:hypothetical protein
MSGCSGPRWGRVQAGKGKTEHSGTFHMLFPAYCPWGCRDSLECYINLLITAKFLCSRIWAKVKANEPSPSFPV